MIIPFEFQLLNLATWNCYGFPTKKQKTDLSPDTLCRSDNQK